MRPHGRARVSARNPQAFAICDRCGFQFNHSDLQWNYSWRGPRLVNDRILVCDTCQDEPQEQARTIILPADPVPISNPRPERYIDADNPVSVQGWEPLSLFNVPTESGNIGNLRNVDAAFRPPANKGSGISAFRDAAVPLGDNYVGKNWCAQTGGPPTLPSQVLGAGIQYTISSFTAQAPSNALFLASGPASLAFQGWTGSSWVGLWADTLAGSAGQTVAMTLTFGLDPSISSYQGPYYGHRFVVVGDVAQSKVAIGSLTMSAAGDGVRSSVPVAQAS